MEAAHVVFRDNENHTSKLHRTFISLQRTQHIGDVLNYVYPAVGSLIYFAWFKDDA